MLISGCMQEARKRKSFVRRLLQEAERALIRQHAIHSCVYERYGLEYQLVGR